MRWLVVLLLSLPTAAFAHNGGITFGLQHRVLRLKLFKRVLGTL